MFLATQYYRPPFPDRRWWRDDLRAIRAAGFKVIEIWSVWAWAEPEPGKFDFADTDELMALAAENDLQVIITSGAELHPYWIHRVVPGCELVDHRGNKVESSTLSYCHAGLTPGGCTDHPEVRRLLALFCETLARRYARAPNLMMWECWNEVRVAVQAEGFTCYCPHTVALYRDWLKTRYRSLEALNTAWYRRFASWDDVPLGKLPRRSWVELLEWQRFLQERTLDTISLRAGALKTGDANHPVICHSVLLSPIMTFGESEYENPDLRGNDWEIAQRVDVFGASYFPAWFHTSPSEYGMGLECARSAAGVRPFWICELQGGAARSGIGVMTPVTAHAQQRWIWMGFGRGARAICFWCWRDEVFARESSGFGISGDDGCAQERIAALTEANRILDENQALFDAYRPSPAVVGVIFDSANHQLEWAESGKNGTMSTHSIKGYIRALERLQVPYDVLDGGHLADLSRFRVVFMPWPMIVRPELARALEVWVINGGLLLTESELGAHDLLGFYHYPKERPFAQAMGVTGQGRRPIDPEETLRYSWHAVGELRAESWLEPLAAEDGEVIARSHVGDIAITRRVGVGRVVVIGTHAGFAYSKERYADFENLINAVLDAGGAAPELRCSISDGEVVQFRAGTSGEDSLLFVTNSGDEADCVFSWAKETAEVRGKGTDILTGRSASVMETDGAMRFRVKLAAGGSHVFRFTRPGAHG